jgi:hypothetical protein
LRLRFKPTKKDEVGVFSLAGDDVFPLIGEAWRSIYSEEVTRRRLAEAVSMVVSAKQPGLGNQCHSGFLGDLPCDRCWKILFGIDTTCGYLRARFGMVSVVEDQKLSSPLDVDDDSLTAPHPGIVRPSVDEPGSVPISLTSQLLGFNLAPRQEGRACERAAVRAVAVVRDDELVRDLIADGSARAAPPQHVETLLPSTAPMFANDD